jgi:hypothetical protein
MTTPYLDRNPKKTKTFLTTTLGSPFICTAWQPLLRSGGSIILDTVAPQTKILADRVKYYSKYISFIKTTLAGLNAACSLPARSQESRVQRILPVGRHDHLHNG